MNFYSLITPLTHIGVQLQAETKQDQNNEIYGSHIKCLNPEYIIIYIDYVNCFPGNNESNKPHWRFFSKNTLVARMYLYFLVH